MDFKEISIHEGPEKSPGFLLWHISTTWRSSIEAVLKPLDLTHPQFVVLASLGWLTQNGERVTQAAVGMMAGIDPNTLSQIMKGLEKKGLLKREASTDGRVKNPVLTLQGTKKLRVALPTVEDADALFFIKANEKELSELMKLFKKLKS